MEGPCKWATLLVSTQDYDSIHLMVIGTLRRLLDPDNVARVIARRMRAAITSYKAPAEVFAPTRSAAQSIAPTVSAAPPHIPTGAFPGILIDVVGGCNAKCPFCVTGREDFGKRINFISVADFARTLDRLIELDFAVPNWTSIGLHNWGEPILHPDLNGIAHEINLRGLAANFSTNASKATRFTVPTNRFTCVNFSVPGWSQQSYDRIHGLRFDRVVRNMEATIANMRETGYAKPFVLAFHVYQFNYNAEMSAARAWCEEHDVTFRPYYALFNDYEKEKAFLTGTMTAAELTTVSRSLFLHYVDDLLASQPPDWECPQWKGQLTLNHKSEILLCCSLPSNHHEATLGSVFELSRDEILSGKTSAKECDDCMRHGSSYWGHHVQSAVS
jgi:MoaA/NifB/PqqE/SkfB family radical SAM enzyme